MGKTVISDGTPNGPALKAGWDFDRVCPSCGALVERGRWCYHGMDRRVLMRRYYEASRKRVLIDEIDVSHHCEVLV